MEKQYKVIINHSGSCMGHIYKKDKEVVLPENVIRAIGKDARILEEVSQGQSLEVDSKEVKKPFFDKMVHGGDTTTK